jgi:hypothetical protein
MYQVQMEFVPGNDMIWVAQLTSEDPIYNYVTQVQAEAKAFELQEADSTGRRYRVVQL